MVMKVSIQFSWPIRFKRIRNGEKIIVQIDPDEFNVDVFEGELKEGSPIKQLHQVLDEHKRKICREKAEERKISRSSNPVVL